MAITYPLTPPAAPGRQKVDFTPRVAVGGTTSIYTGEQKFFAYPGEWWLAEITLPQMTDAQIEDWLAFLLALKGPSGTFWLGDSILKAPRGTVGGSWTVAAGAVAGSSTLPITGGTGAFSKGDWMQVANHLHKVMQVNAGSVDVFPCLPAAYANGTAITYTAAKGLFRLLDTVPWAAGRDRIYEGLVIRARSDL
jgi:hypothetical protein